MQRQRSTALQKRNRVTNRAMLHRDSDDDSTFAEYSAKYNYRTISDRRLVFARLVIKECDDFRGKGEHAVRALDIGSGTGIGREQRFTEAIRRRVDELWGVEPDRTVAAREGLYDRLVRSTMEDASLPSSYFDVAYSFMVMEHVTRPHEFLAALSECLRPSGVYLFATPNGRHAFTRLARLAAVLKMDGLLLAAIKGRAHKYHYPVFYRFNRQKEVVSLALHHGFGDVRYAYFEETGLRGYLPGPLRPLYHLLAMKRRLLHDPTALITMIGRMEKK